MVEKWNRVYQVAIANAEIAAGASESFVIPEDKVRNFGMGNELVITNISTENIKIQLDGKAENTIAFGVGTFGIEPEDGESFRFVKITNLDGANAIAANELIGYMGRSEVVN